MTSTISLFSCMNKSNNTKSKYLTEFYNVYYFSGMPGFAACIVVPSLFKLDAMTLSQSVVPTPVIK